MRKESIKPFVWGMLISAIIVLIVSFSTGWVVTSSSAKEAEQKKSREAIVYRLADIGIAQCQMDPKKEERLKELKAKKSWERTEYVEKIGWATMPGEKSPSRGVASECVKRLMEIN